MGDYNRQELQDDIFKMYAACVESDGKKSGKAPIDIDRLKKLLTGSSSNYEEIDFETELDYLIGSRYFEMYATHFIVPTTHGMNKIWGKTTNLPLRSNDKAVKWWEKTWIQVIFLVSAVFGIWGFIYSRDKNINQNINGNNNTQIMGNNNIVGNDMVNLLPKNEKQEELKEYIFVNDLFYVQAVADSNNKVLLYSVTTRQKDFNPSLKILDDSIEIILGKTKFSDINEEPEKEYGWAGAHSFFYTEEYYFGNPGNYASYYFSINDAGYLNLIEDFPYNLFVNENFIKDNPTEMQKFRENSIINTYTVASPFLGIMEKVSNFSFGPSHHQVGVVKNNNENLDKSKWIRVLQNLYADVSINYFMKALGDPMFINKVN